MSAWGIGATNAQRRVTAPAEGVDAPPAAGQAPQLASVDALITWIPGEVIAAYAAIVLALQPEAVDGETAPVGEITSQWWLVAAVIFAALLTWLGGWSKSDDLKRSESLELGARVLLSAIAFVIWSFVVPGSWWYSIDTIAENQTLIPIIAGLVGAAFGLFAEGAVRRVAKRVATP